MSRIPENWNVTYRLANTDFGPEGTMKVLSSWTSCSDVDQVVHALVGVPSSRSAKIASTIANVYNLPVISFGATDNDLADKAMYPTFSRTTPGTAPMLQAMAGMMKYFGWGAFNILSDDTEFAMAQVSGLVKATSEYGIGVASTHIYSYKGGTTDTLAVSTGIESAVAALASAMYNSSSVSRSRVTVIFSAKAENIADVLSYGVQQDIMGEGFVWLHMDSGVHLEDFADTIPFRRAVAGFLRMSQSPGSKRIADRALNQAADRSVMWHETIDEFGHFIENHAALECDDCFPWQDKVFGDRAALVLTYNLENLQGPVDTGDRRDAWNDFKI